MAGHCKAVQEHHDGQSARNTQMQTALDRRTEEATEGAGPQAAAGRLTLLETR